MRQGRSFVAETGHTVILGWSPRIFTILGELIEANQNQRRACVAILAERDAVEMQDEIAARIPRPGRTRIFGVPGESEPRDALSHGRLQPPATEP